eukprot:3084424-Pyramimonas_sp.AAC.1
MRHVSGQGKLRFARSMNGPDTPRVTGRGGGKGQEKWRRGEGKGSGVWEWGRRRSGVVGKKGQGRGVGEDEVRGSPSPIE